MRTTAIGWLALAILAACTAASPPEAVPAAVADGGAPVEDSAETDGQWLDEDAEDYVAGGVRIREDASCKRRQVRRRLCRHVSGQRNISRLYHGPRACGQSDVHGWGDPLTPANNPCNHLVAQLDGLRRGSRPYRRKQRELCDQAQHYAERAGYCVAGRELAVEVCGLANDAAHEDAERRARRAHQQCLGAFRQLGCRQLLGKDSVPKLERVRRDAQRRLYCI